MPQYSLIVSAPRPYFAEFPYALWGEVNYNSEGNCRRPTDQEWTVLELTHRETGAELTIRGTRPAFQVASEDPALAAQAAVFLAEHTGTAVIEAIPQALLDGWSYRDAYARTARIRAEFPRPELIPFDSHLFWGSWKWVGWFATQFTWVGRQIMNAVLTRDVRAVFLCIDWLKSGTFHPDQSAALRHALALLTTQHFPSDQEWVAWYEREGQRLYPVPDSQAWENELKRSGG
jgi:hypothetical protein